MVERRDLIIARLGAGSSPAIGWHVGKAKKPTTIPRKGYYAAEGDAGSIPAGGSPFLLLKDHIPVRISHGRDYSHVLQETGEPGIYAAVVQW